MFLKYFVEVNFKKEKNNMESGSISRQKIKSKKQQISVTIQPELLIKLDKLASALGQSRASIINIAIYHVVENGLEINKTNQLDL